MCVISLFFMVVRRFVSVLDSYYVVWRAPFKPAFAEVDIPVEILLTNKEINKRNSAAHL